jgi:predicted lipid-binding transport protein (Tim44 family)
MGLRIERENNALALGFHHIARRPIPRILGILQMPVSDSSAIFGLRDAYGRRTMDSVTAVRSQVPLPASGSPPAPDRLSSAPAAQTQKPVTETMRGDAVLQPATLSAQVAVELADRDEDQDPATAARAAADAAREAYIRASIAAGLSPLPLP